MLRSAVVQSSVSDLFGEYIHRYLYSEELFTAVEQKRDESTTGDVILKINSKLLEIAHKKGTEDRRA